MPRTLEQIQRQIAQLQQEAETLRSQEIKGVIARIRVAIKHYGLTPKDLFGTAAAAPGPRGRRSGGKPKRTASPPKYRDDAGHTWTGHGKRPNWFKAAIAAGKTPEDLLIK